MSDSLADQAATWVPPWARQPSSPASSSSSDEDAAGTPADTEAEVAAVEGSLDAADDVDAERESGAAVGEPVTDSDTVADAGVVGDADGLAVGDTDDEAEADAQADDAAASVADSWILEDLAPDLVPNSPRSDGEDAATTAEPGISGEWPTEADDVDAADPVAADSSAILVIPTSNTVSELPRSGDGAWPELSDAARTGEPRETTELAGTGGAAASVETVGTAEPEAAASVETVGTAEPEAAEKPEMDPADLRGAVEAILLVVDEPVSEIVLAQVLDLPVERITTVLDELATEYTAQRRGFDLRRAAGGYRLYTRGDYARYVERFVLDGQQVRLTQAALETLAVIAYKQPVTRSRISAIRGVNCDGVVRTLLSRGLIEECGSEPDSGAFLYRTTTLFLEKLGLDSVDELPPLAPFLPDDVDEIANAQS